MEFRESISYDTDFITGVIKKAIKKKPLNSPMINTTTVQLFDAKTGKKIREIKSENIILNATAKFAYMDYFYNRIKGSISSTAYIAPWQVLVLTDSNSSEDATLTYLKGNIIAWADKATPYSGTDGSRGSVNLSETSLDAAGNGDLHFVFDFPTNAANGTFQTVWWAGAKAPSLLQQWSYRGISPVVVSGCVISCISVSAGGSFSKYSLTDGSYQGSISTVNLPQIYCTGGEYDGTNVWILDASAQKIHKFTGDMTVWLSSVAITGWNTATWGNASSTSDITELNGTLYVISYNYFVVSINASTGACIAGTDIRVRCGLASNFSASSTGITCDGAGKFYVSYPDPNIIFILDVNLNYLGIIASPPNYNNPRTSSYDRTNGYIYYWSNYGGGLYGIKCAVYSASPGAQNLLPSPVTKTATNTMKIQYDFQIQKV